MAHHYQIKGGSLLMVKYSGVTDTNFSFYIFDPKSKAAAYCWYGSKPDSKKFAEADLQGKIIRHQAGLGTQIMPLLLQKPLDFKHIQGTVCSLSLSGKGRSDPGSADLLMNKAPAIHLVFPILADFQYGPAQSNGWIGEVKTAQTSVPELPAYFKHDNNVP
jgi:hypothetical protein